ncbi:MAG: orotidine 5'-phosphate decarboxylase [Pseudomonadota bacterium]
MLNIRVHNLQYNPQAGGFQARVDIKRDDTTYRYPDHFSGPMTMDRDIVCHGLTQQALRMSDSGTALVSRF